MFIFQIKLGPMDARRPPIEKTSYPTKISLDCFTSVRPAQSRAGPEHSPSRGSHDWLITLSNPRVPEFVRKINIRKMHISTCRRKHVESLCRWVLTLTLRTYPVAYH